MNNLKKNYKSVCTIIHYLYYLYKEAVLFILIHCFQQCWYKLLGLLLTDGDLFSSCELITVWGSVGPTLATDQRLSTLLWSKPPNFTIHWGCQNAGGLICRIKAMFFGFFTHWCMHRMHALFIPQFNRRWIQSSICTQHATASTVPCERLLS